MKKFLLLSLMAMIAIISHAGENDLLWDYTNANIPTTKNQQGIYYDNGLYYGSYVNDAVGTNLGLHGVKLDSKGYAYFEKAAVAGKLKLVISNRKNTSDFKVDVYRGSLVNGVPQKGELIATTAAAQGPQEVTVELDETVTGIYIFRNTPAEGVLCKVKFTETIPRNFVDFEYDFRKIGAMPEITSSSIVKMSGSPRNDDHGLDNFKMEVNVDGPVKFTIGGCQFSNTNAVVKNGDTVLKEIDVKTPGCYHNGGTATWIYNSMEPATLTIIGAQFTPYIKAEACEFVEDVTITYWDQEGNKLGEQIVPPGTAFAPKYTVNDLPAFGEDKAFRGWFNNAGKKFVGGETIDDNTVLTAKVTAVEVATTGSHFDYDMTNSYWYQEDHELIDITGNYYNNHGWNLTKIDLQVSKRAVVIVKNCVYSAQQTVTVTYANGNQVASFDLPASADGASYSFNYDGTDATTLTLSFASGAYVHGIEVYNVAGFVTKDETTGYTIIGSGDASSLMLALKSAQAGDKIFLPNGTYDFGETRLTTISANNLSIIGQSTEGVIIKNAPDKKKEGLGSAELFQNTSTGLYMQDLTLQNDLDYYAAGTGRAPVLQDKGTQTIMKNVNMRSYQDTYYSKNGNYYFEGGLIQGTVDYICGDGNAYFNGVTLLNKSRSATEKTGQCTITAAYTSSGLKGYVFNNCTIESECTTFNFGRSWGGAMTAFINTTIKSGKLIDTRWTLEGMNSVPVSYKEYNTVDNSGNGMNTPTSNVLTFTHKSGNSIKMETILTEEEAANYTVDKIFTSWDPVSIAAQATADKDNIDADAYYLVENNGEFVAIVKGSDVATYTEGTIRKANARGGFGEAVSLSGSDGIHNITNVAAENADAPRFNTAGQRVGKSFKGLVICNGKKYIK